MNICIIGAAGRMGNAIAEIIEKSGDLKLSGAVDRSEGRVKGVELTSDILKGAVGANVVIDFTAASVTMSNLKNYETLGLPVIIGSTGLTDDDKLKLVELSKKIPVLYAPNMSIGVNVALKLIDMAAKALQGYDIEIIETHHKHKKDAPSGTALRMAEVAAKARGLNLNEHAVYERNGIIGERKENEIGVQTIRGGDVVGDHTVFFFGNGEHLEITHKAHTRDTFANGAVEAARWMFGKEAGMYSINDVLGVK